ncbi:unnamed protein product, partial [Closterium sp. NIES-64]
MFTIAQLLTCSSLSRVRLSRHHRCVLLFILVCFALSPLQLLQKAGWHQGRGLGVAEQGRLNPVPPSLKFDKVGLGGPSSSHVPFSSRPQSAPTLSHTTPPAAGQPHTAQATAGVAGSGFSRAVTDALDNELDLCFCAPYDLGLNACPLLLL